MNTRLKQFLAAENITQAQFADSINVVRASVSHIISGRNNPSFDFIKAMMSNYPNLNMDWLIFGKGKMYKDTPAQSQSPEYELLFPEDEQETVQESQKNVHVAIEQKNETFSSELNALYKDIQNAVQQRKVAKIIVMFDDGTYQEM